MRLLKARVVGFQSFADSGEISFGSGINLLVGQNNAGKSALLRALQLDMANDRHRTPENWLDAALPQPYTDFTFEISGEEIKTATLEVGQATTIPAPYNAFEGAVLYVERLLEKSDIRVRIRRQSGVGFVASYPSHGRFQYVNGSMQMAGRLFSSNGTLKIEQHNNGEDTIPGALARMWQTSMF